MSAVTPIADKRGCDWFVRFVPEADIVGRSLAATAQGAIITCVLITW